ncbi:PHP domain-containing protein, partial [bacterium]|nr:PHP domain-containing protein [candidate division CSSED10-310 bacterium]
MDGFVHLNVHSAFSMLDGTADVPALAAAAAAAGMDTLALTDTDGMYGVVPFTRACAVHGIRPVYGVELSEPFRGDRSAYREYADGRTLRRATLLARDKGGYEAVCRVVTRRHLMRDFDWEESVVVLPDSVFVLTDDVPVLRRRAVVRRDRDATRVEIRHFGGPDSMVRRRRLIELAETLSIRPV